MDTDYIFLSYVGNQKWGTLNSLMVLLAKNQKEKYPLSKIILIYTGETSTYAYDIKAEYDLKRKSDPSIPEVELYEINYHDLVFEHLLEDLPSKIIYNISGGMNFNTAYAVNTLYKTDSLMLSTCKEKAYLFDLKNFAQKTIPLSKPKSVNEILREQGLELVPNSNPSDLCEFIKAKKIKLPQGTEQNKILNGVPCDLIWNDGSNRLVFVSSVLDVDDGKNNRELLERVRDLAFVGASKVLTGNLYDRKWYVLCSREADIEHTNNESRSKSEALDVYGKFDKGEFVSLNGVNLSEKLIYKLKEIIKGDLNKSDITNEVMKFQVTSDTLVIVISDNVTLTLNAIYAHKKMHNIKNVVLLASHYDNILTARDSVIHSPLLKEEFNFYSIVSDINASDIKKNLTFKEGSTNVHVNITPGTKAQCAALAFWAKKRGAGIWSIDKDDVASILDINDKSGIGMNKAIDILTILSCKYNDVSDVKFDHDGYHELYNFMKECLVAHQKNPNIIFRRPKENNPLKVAGYTLENEVAGIYEKEQYGRLILKTSENKTYSLSYKGGDWFEKLVAQSFIEAGFEHVHSRVRVNFPESDKLQNDMDVICSFRYVHCLISCKAQTIGNEYANPLAKTVNEAINNAASLNRFALGAVCYLEKDTDERFCYPQEGLDEVDANQKLKETLVFDWKDLCNPEGLREKFNKLLLSKQTKK
ncbi:MAG: hypothetical protein UHG91_05070 [Succinivibrionaceae bacterium]|nr:hypothetical protein [Succinivibrionaceae bacterium]